MTRISLLRGVSACALTFAVITPALAQQSLPTIDVGGHRQTARRATPSRTAGPVNAQPAQPAENSVADGNGDSSGAVSRWSPTLPDGKPAFVQRWQLPNTVASITRQQIERKINMTTSDDALKYMPSLFLRKLNPAGGLPNTGVTVQTRTWGVGSSARSLVYADDLLLTALIANNNGIGSPMFGLVAPEEIERVDVLYGPFAAQYSGNSMGGVIKYTTRMPEKLEVSVKDTVSIQDFRLWGTNKSLVNNITGFFVGNKYGDLSYTFSGNWSPCRPKLIS